MSSKPTDGNWYAKFHYSSGNKNAGQWVIVTDDPSLRFSKNHPPECVATVSYVLPKQSSDLLKRNKDVEEMNARIMAASKNLTILAWKLSRSKSTDAKTVEDLVIEAREIIFRLGL